MLAILLLLILSAQALQSTASQMDSFIASDFNLCHALTTVLTAFIKVYNTYKYHKFTIAYKNALS